MGKNYYNVLAYVTQRLIGKGQKIVMVYSAIYYQKSNIIT